MPTAIHKNKSSAKTKNWVVYILKCRGGRLYTGITNNLKKRLAAHKAGLGARFTRAFAPVRLAWSRGGYTHSKAARREAAIKKLPRTAKKKLLSGSKQRPVKK